MESLPTPNLPYHSLYVWNPSGRMISGFKRGSFMHAILACAHILPKLSPDVKTLTLQTLSLQSFANSFSEADKHSYQEHCPGNPDLLFLSCGPEKVYQMHYAPDVLCEVMNTAGFLRSWGEREELLHMGSMTPDAPQAFEICCYDRYSLHFGAEPQAIQSTFPESYRI